MPSDAYTAPWRQRNDRLTCVCGATRDDIANRVYRVLPWHDSTHAPYFYRCSACGTFSVLNLYFNVDSYRQVPIEAYSIPELKWLLNRARVEWIRVRAGTALPYNPVVYDLGSGEGCFVSCFREAFPHAKITAVEADGRMKERFAVEYAGTEFMEEPIESFLGRPGRAGLADLVILTDVLEHVLEPETLLLLIVDALKDTGFAYITLPNLDSFGDFPHHVPTAQIASELAEQTGQHLWMMAPRIVNDLINRTFTIVEMSRSFEAGIRRDSDYSTFLVRPAKSAALQQTALR